MLMVRSVKDKNVHNSEITSFENLISEKPLMEWSHCPKFIGEITADIFVHRLTIAHFRVIENISN